jgi:hypothetical protein
VDWRERILAFIAYVNKQRSVTKLRAIKIPTFQVCEEQCTIFL